MKVEKIFFVGLGGAGQRHLRIFHRLLSPSTPWIAYRRLEKTPLLNPDFSVDRKLTLEQKYNLQYVTSLKEGFAQKPDLVVIATPSSLHDEPAMEAAERGIHVFMEKPFSDRLRGFETFRELVLYRRMAFFISYQRRFHPYLQKIKRILEKKDLGKIIRAVFNVGSYVPSWHPYEDFKKLYACRKDLGGGVLLTEIHELDLCYWFFGCPQSVYCAGGNFSVIKLDVEDTAQVILKYKDFAAQVNLCFMQQKNQRDLYIAGTKGFVEWAADGNELKIQIYGSKAEIFSDPKLSHDDLFIAQARYFLKNVSPKNSRENLAAAAASLAIVVAAKISMRKNRDIPVPKISE